MDTFRHFPYVAFSPDTERHADPDTDHSNRRVDARPQSTCPPDSYSRYHVHKLHPHSTPNNERHAAPYTHPSQLIPQVPIHSQIPHCMLLFIYLFLYIVRDSTGQNESYSLLRSIKLVHSRVSWSNHRGEMYSLFILARPVAIAYDRFHREFVSTHNKHRAAENQFGGDWG